MAYRKPKILTTLSDAQEGFFNAFESATEPYPTLSGARLHNHVAIMRFGSDESPARLSRRPEPDEIVLRSLRVLKRGQKHGVRAMEFGCGLANDFSLKVGLEVAPFKWGDKEPRYNREQLAGWYGQFGFKFDEAYRDDRVVRWVMWRQPGVTHYRK